MDTSVGVQGLNWVCRACVGVLGLGGVGGLLETGGTWSSYGGKVGYCD